MARTRWASAGLVLAAAWGLDASAVDSFTPATTYDVGRRPGKIVTGDFNGDTRPDLAMVASGDLGLVMVLYGGPAGFGSLASVDVGLPALGLTATDFDDDGYDDLAALARQVRMLWGGPSGIAGSPTGDYAVGAEPKQIAAADLNGDDALDVLVTNGADDSLSILYQTGARSFGGRRDFAVGNRPFDLVAADFDGDGRGDVATANSWSDTVTLLYGRIDGGLGGRDDYAVGDWPDRIGAADLNGDLRMDLVAGGNDIRLTILYGLPGGGFGSMEEYLVAERGDVAIADFDADGRLDLALSRVSHDEVCILYGQAAGGFGGVEYYPVDETPYWLVIGDFDLNGYPDIATSNHDGRSVSVLHNVLPEPATLALLGVGALGLLRRRRARKRGLGGIAQGSRSSSRSRCGSSV